MSPDADASGADGEAAAAAAAQTSPSAATGGGGRGGRPVIRWDQILPRRSLRMLLVEHDDSTRQVIAALLRKCGYHVAAVADGMKAWEVMRERSYAFDLALTEVAMPTLSGIELLSRIAAAEECKNIPVIMMSSQDSIGVVLKCMLKGAVDFLVKPVRKNELRNLWQHVWRRHCMNSQTNASETNAASNHISVNAANGSKTGENSGEGSDSQSSGSKREMEVQSVENAQQVVTVQWAGSLREIGDKQQKAHGGITMKAHVLDTSDDMPSGNKFDINSTPTYSPEKNVHPKCFSTATSGKVTGRDDALRIANASSRHPNDPGDVLLAFSEPIADRKCNSSLMEKNVGENALSEYSNGAAKERAESCPSHLLEINLGKQRLNGCMNRGFREKDIFTHSNFSAFSRYVNKGIQPSAQKPFLPSLCEGPQEFLNDEDSILQPYEVLLSHKHKTGESSMQVQVPLNSSKEGVAIFCSSSVREDTGTSNSSPRKDSCSHPQFGFIPVPIPIGSAIPYQNLCAGYGAISQPIYYPQASFMLCDSAAIKKLEENQKLHHPMQTQRESGELARIPLDQVNWSTSCSQGIRKGSGCTGSGETADANTNTNTTVVLESGNESGVQNYSSKGLDNDRSRREAALIKFRMKRKDRCFEKKVRYHSRKKLAEQRPRVKGQFVSQKLKSATTTHAETDFRIVVDL